MASIDKIYFYDQNDVTAFSEYLDQSHAIIKYHTGYDPRGFINYSPSESLMTTSFPYAVDAYLWDDCGVPTVYEGLRYQYDSKPETDKPKYASLGRNKFKTKRLLRRLGLILDGFFRVELFDADWHKVFIQFESYKSSSATCQVFTELDLILDQPNNSEFCVIEGLYIDQGDRYIDYLIQLRRFKGQWVLNKWALAEDVPQHEIENWKRCL